MYSPSISLPIESVLSLGKQTSLGSQQTSLGSQWPTTHMSTIYKWMWNCKNIAFTLGIDSDKGYSRNGCMAHSGYLSQ